MVKQYEDLEDLELEAAHPVIRRLVTAGKVLSSS